MGQISTLNSIQTPLTLPAGSDKTTRATKNPATETVTPNPVSDNASTANQVQLSKLSTILNNFNLGTAALSRPQYVSAASKVKSGTYKTDSLEISKSIITDHLFGLSATSLVQ